jgi:hypothetical protein
VIFTLQKRIVRIMSGAKPKISCRSLFARLEIFPLLCECIFSLVKFAVNNKEHFQTNSAIHSVNTRNRNHLHRPVVSLSCFKKMHIFSTLSSCLKGVMNKEAQFKVALKKYLNIHSSYSVY